MMFTSEQACPATDIRTTVAGSLLTWKFQSDFLLWAS